MKAPNDKQLTKLARHQLDKLNEVNLISPNLKDIRNEILQKILQINQNKVLVVLTPYGENLAM